MLVQANGWTPHIPKAAIGHGPEPHCCKFCPQKQCVFLNNYVIFYLLLGHPRGYFPRCFTLKFCMYYLSPPLL